MRVTPGPTGGRSVPIRAEVVVIGGGLAGTVAAVAAAREGADVRLLSHKKSTLRQASGLIDALGYVPDSAETERSERGDAGVTDAGAGAPLQKRRDVDALKRERGPYRGPLANPFDGLSDLPAGHPYAAVGGDALRDGLALFDDLAGDLYAGGHTERNALLPTFGGTVKPTARYPVAAAAGLASDPRPALVVGFRSLTGFDARLVADRLAAAGVPFDATGAEVRFAAGLGEASRTRIARALDRDEPIDGTPARAALAAAIEPHIGDAERVGLPAVLGDDQPAEVRAELADRLGVDVFEIPGGPPSLPGLRLEDRLFEALEAAGVRYETGNPVTGYDADGDRIESLRVDRGGRDAGQTVAYAAESVVLATGGLVGKGIESDREGVREPIFGCHVPHPDDRYDWFVDDALGDQPYARFGVRPDGDLRPLDAGGDPEFCNLRAAGATLGGADVAREKSASGVSLATGVAAGRAAAREVRG